MTTRGSRIDWLVFLALGFLWGSSYLFIKIGVDHGLQPFTLITFRLAIGAALLASVVAYFREPLPRDPRMYGHLAVMGVVNIAIPFALITYAEQVVDSSLAAVINGAVPLFVIVIAALFLREQITVNRVIGLALGFVGIAVLVGLDVTQIGSANSLGELALVGATISYAIGAVYAKAHIHGLRPMIPALFQVFFGLVVISVLAFATEHPLAAVPAPEALFAVVWLGLLGSGLAYLAFFRTLGRWGATRTSMVAYLLPIVGIALGAIVLQEPLAPSTLLGTVLVIAGIALVNARMWTRPLFVRGGNQAAGAASSTGPNP
ncbi:MAG TPA: EamA family transporter [Candidatus Limnocylindrales bacterium]|jgi:drug/metabolite transporter (DMT)-like permease|nr:EamA family transporter [Candidatus Limnocylindrales bacterium]